jgi:hypothetical protein
MMNSNLLQVPIKIQIISLALELNYLGVLQKFIDCIQRKQILSQSIFYLLPQCWTKLPYKQTDGQTSPTHDLSHE